MASSRARVRATFTHPKPSVGLREGDLRDATDPLVVQHPEWFEPAPDREEQPDRRTEPVVEQATAAPGEKRSTRRH